MDLAKSDNSALAPLVGFFNLPTVRQLGLMFGLAASVALGVAVVLWSQDSNYGVLYSGLETKDASAVVDELQKKGIGYKLDPTTGAIMVPSDRVPDVRLLLADTGLPRSAGVGFDLLQKKQEFGTSQFMETARFHRALEGELARSVTSIAAVESARVHLALPKQSVFVRKRQEPSASVLVNLYSGRSLEPEQVSAISHLVASSIPNLEPGRVTVVDQRGRLLSDRQRDSEMAASQDHLDYTRRLEEDYVARIENILMPFVGLEGVRAQVSADVDFSVTEQTQETYNPDLPAPRSEQVFEQETRNGAEAGGVPGALSNQPPGEASVPEQMAVDGEAAAEDKPIKSVRRSTVNYELDRTISHTKLATGQIKRISVAVVVDDKVVENGGELTREPRTPQEIERITALVKEAVGYSAQRGDTINIMNASFASAGFGGAEPLPEPPLWKQSWVWDLARQAGAGLLALVLVMGLLRVMRNLAHVKPQSSAAGTELAPVAAGAPAHAGMADDQVSLSGSTTETVRLPGPDQAYEDNLNQAREMAMQDPKRVAQVVKTWVSDDD